jgi:hypothetical protein
VRLFRFVRDHLPWWLHQYVRGRVCLWSAVQLAWLESGPSGFIGFCDPWPKKSEDETP